MIKFISVFLAIVLLSAPLLTAHAAVEDAELSAQYFQDLIALLKKSHPDLVCNVEMGENPQLVIFGKKSNRALPQAFPNGDILKFAADDKHILFHKKSNGEYFVYASKNMRPFTTTASVEYFRDSVNSAIEEAGLSNEVPVHLFGEGYYGELKSYLPGRSGSATFDRHRFSYLSGEERGFYINLGITDDRVGKFEKILKERISFIEREPRLLETSENDSLKFYPEKQITQFKFDENKGKVVRKRMGENYEISVTQLALGKSGLQDINFSRQLQPLLHACRAAMIDAGVTMELLTNLNVDYRHDENKVILKLPKNDLSWAFSFESNLAFRIGELNHDPANAELSFQSNHATRVAPEVVEQTEHSEFDSLESAKNYLGWKNVDGGINNLGGNSVETARWPLLKKEGDLIALEIDYRYYYQRLFFDMPMGERVLFKARDLPMTPVKTLSGIYLVFVEQAYKAKNAYGNDEKYYLFRTLDAAEEYAKYHRYRVADPQ